MKPVVAVDLDDLLYPFMDALVPFHNERYGTALTVRDFHTFQFEDVWGGNRDDALVKVAEFFSELEEHPLPMKGASVAIDKLADHFSLVIVTSRFDELREMTIDWVETHFPLRFADVRLCNTYVLSDPPVSRTKASVCTEIEAVALVDDSLQHVSEAAAAGVKGILFGDYPWNAAPALPDGVVRAANWDDVLDVLLHEVRS